MTARRGANHALARARGPLVPLAVAGAFAALTAVSAVQGRLVLHDCVSAVGSFGALGLRLDLLQDAADCPEGSYGLGGVSRGAVLMLSVALPVLVGYLLATALGVGLGAALVRVSRHARSFLRAVLPRLRADDAPHAPAWPVDPVPTARPAPRSTWLLVGSIARRGPPPVAVA